MDPDPFPSIPHGHNNETGDKLDVYDGVVYNKDGNPIKRLNSKKLEEMQKKLFSNFSFP